MTLIKELESTVLSGKSINQEQAYNLYYENLDILCESANKIREHFCKDKFDLCTIVNAKSGKCSEHCKFCAQSAHHNTAASEYPLLTVDEILIDAKKNKEQGITRYALVTSGRTLSKDDTEKICTIARTIIDQLNISVCVSAGLLDENQLKALKEAGVSRIHNNLETSKNNFANICTTHTFQDKVATINAAKKINLPVCSGGIIGLGETVKDRINLAFSLKSLNIKSIPINRLNPIPGTPLGDVKGVTDEDLLRTIAVFRFINPDALIRLAGGRGLLEDKGLSCFKSGANAAISGDMLTTSGISVASDLAMLEKLNYKVEGVKNE